MTGYGSKFRAAVSALHDSGLAERPWRVRIVEGLAMQGFCGEYRRGTLFIAAGLPTWVAIDSLIHELAHHIDLTPEEQAAESWRKDHRASWGAAYARVLEWYHANPPEWRKRKRKCA